MQSFSDNPALRAQLESQVNFMTELSQKTYDAVRQLSEINLRMAQQVIEDSMNIGREMMTCTDPMQLAQTAFKQMQPATEHLRNYQQQVLGVLTGAQREFTRTAEARLPEVGRGASAMANDLMRSAGAAMHMGSGAPASSSGNGSAEGAAHNPT
jgi:phasin family protein